MAVLARKASRTRKNPSTAQRAVEEVRQMSAEKLNLLIKESRANTPAENVRRQHEARVTRAEELAARYTA